MRRGHPSQKPAHLAILFRPQYDVPVVGHYLQREQLHGVSLQSLPENSFERFVIRVFAKNGGACVPAIQGVVESAPFVGSRWSWHVTSLPNSKINVNES
jgi:hypothetical protein